MAKLLSFSLQNIYNVLVYHKILLYDKHLFFLFNRRVFAVLYLKKKVFQLMKTISIFSYVELFPGKYLVFSISTLSISLHRLVLDTTA